MNTNIVESVENNWGRFFNDLFYICLHSNTCVLGITLTSNYLKNATVKTLESQCRATGDMFNENIVCKKQIDWIFFMECGLL